MRILCIVVAMLSCECTWRFVVCSACASQVYAIKYNYTIDINQEMIAVVSSHVSLFFCAVLLCVFLYCLHYLFFIRFACCVFAGHCEYCRCHFPLLSNSGYAYVVRSSTCVCLMIERYHNLWSHNVCWLSFSLDLLCCHRTDDGFVCQSVFVNCVCVWWCALGAIGMSAMLSTFGGRSGMAAAISALLVRSLLLLFHNCSFLFRFGLNFRVRFKLSGCFGTAVFYVSCIAVRCVVLRGHSVLLSAQGRAGYDCYERGLSLPSHAHIHEHTRVCRCGVWLMWTKWSSCIVATDEICSSRVCWYAFPFCISFGFP